MYQMLGLYSSGARLDREFLYRLLALGSATIGGAIFINIFHGATLLPVQIVEPVLNILKQTRRYQQPLGVDMLIAAYIVAFSAFIWNSIWVVNYSLKTNIDDDNHLPSGNLKVFSIIVALLFGILSAFVLPFTDGDLFSADNLLVFTVLWCLLFVGAIFFLADVILLSKRLVSRR